MMLKYKTTCAVFLLFLACLDDSTANMEAAKSDRSTVSVSSSACNPHGWRCVPGKSCYFVYSGQHYSWSSAKQQCALKGAKLVTINDNFEDAFIREIARLEGYMWIGFNDITTEGYWRWDDGSQVTFFNWAQGRPSTSSSNTNDCAVLHRYSNGQWYDQNCNTAYGYICEKKFT
ncbi:perlucin-like protein isoform X2 [Ptychodera flava]|uniref:perlucin-like protein isoform X2 n=1 Tax=Ptychodera flava TaxID=63121 RepID=UPI00396A41A6